VKAKSKVKMQNAKWALPFCILTFSFCLILWTDSAAAATSRSITNRTVAWPAAEQWRRTLLLTDYNTRVVVLGATLLGLAAGTIGTFTLLRKRALMGDALSHATLPGIVLAFLIVTLAGGDGKSLPVLLTGATISGVLGLGAVLFLRESTRLKEDAALGIVLSVFFGAGAALMGVVQQMPAGHAAGLESFIYGKTASMLASDAWLIAATSAVVLAACLLLFKEFRLLCFDQEFAASSGLRTLSLDVAMLALVVMVTVIGLQAVGLILVIALLVIPAAAARFWTERMSSMAVIAAMIGAVSAAVGALMSALFPNLPSGAMIVVVATLAFGFSLVFGSQRGLAARISRHATLVRRIGRQNLLRAMYEQREANRVGGASVPETSIADEGPRISMRQLIARRSWSPRELRRLIVRAARENLVVVLPEDELKFTRRGLVEAQRFVRQHRLWELYLITHADIAPSHVDRDADAIEHVLAPEMIAELEALLGQTEKVQAVMESPHPVH
jgi:manganese/zinc/iron transport system permease protein